MPRQDTIDCPKESFDWEDRTERTASHGPTRSRPASAGTLKNSYAQWGYQVRSMYDVPRRILRAYRWYKRSRFVAPTIDRLFNEQATRWKEETAHLSSVTKMLAHPSYLRIIGLSEISTDYELERLILHELENDPDYWFDALAAITGENPVQPQHDFDESVSAWLEWGRRKGIV
jgi:hypothetical protein